MALNKQLNSQMAEFNLKYLFFINIISSKIYQNLNENIALCKVSYAVDEEEFKVDLVFY